MALEDKHLDVLQNIEGAIVTVYRNDQELRDQDAIKGLDAAIAYYRAIDTRKEFVMPESVDGKGVVVFNAITAILGLREDILGDNPAPKRKRFSRALRSTSKEEIYLVCLRKIQKSAKRWNKRNGENGYLDFVKNYT
ncbi:MAG: hypothetical protein AAGJ18_17485 [Bacteroidota bacterium]